MIYILLAELSLLAFPIIGLSFYKPLKSSKNYQKFLIYSIILLSIVFSLKFLKISLKGDLSDIIVISLIYFLYVCLVPFFKGIKNKIIRNIMMFLSYIPIILGYILGTIGFFGVVLVGIDSEVNEIVRINENIEYRKYMNGFVFSSSKTSYEFYESKEYSLFEKNIGSFVLSDNEKNEEKVVVLKENQSNYHIKIVSDTEILIDTLILK